ncbi:hypothetical protein C2845_PM02G05720 [Panicum miliaceum]|uniref:UDP-glycosyltransferase 83A1-like n=1 Tax=Panicum miliaceum TaxID=4540 RepID=A0A3L6SA50_PANMI|nr:hypothetical protein C2845_PM02G05720 [Panicum miliaceum]
MPPLHTSRLSWNNAGAPGGQPAVFQLVTRNNEAKDLAEVIVGNSFRDAEPGAFKLHPEILPIGPLVADLQFKKPVGQFLPEDAGCLEWLDAQPGRSVVSRSSHRPFLWVVRPDFAAGLSKAWLDEFQRRVGGSSMIVSRCWRTARWRASRNGVPFLCWPYFTDQFQNESYICNVWRTGLAVAPGADGVVTKEELSGKVERVLGDDGIRERVGALRDAARRSIAEGGSSHQNLMKFVELLKE